MARNTTLTKDEFITLIREMMEDPDSVHWTAVNLDLLIRVTQDSLFARLLEHFPYFVSQLDTLTATLTSPGVISVADGGDLTKRFHRLQKVTRNQQEYTPVDARDYVIEGDEVQAVNSRSDFVYFFFGDQLQILPFNVDDDIEVRYSFKPTLWGGLAGGATPDWPDGQENALIYAVARRGMAKGSREETSEVKELERESWLDLISDIERQFPGPTTPYLSDSPEGWGGE